MIRYFRSDQIRPDQKETYTLTEVKYQYKLPHGGNPKNEQQRTSQLIADQAPQRNKNVVQAPEIADFDQERFSTLITELKEKSKKLGTTRALNSVIAASSTLPAVIRVLVNYTPAYRDESGGNDLAVALITQRIAQVNAILLNSRVETRFVLAHAAPVSYTEVNHSTDLNWYKNEFTRSDKTVFAQRNDHLADVGILMRKRAIAADYCGEVGYPFQVATTAYGSITSDCDSVGQTTAHELGHMLGARHDIDQDPASTPYAWGHGWLWRIDPNTKRATRGSVMSYAPDISTDGVYKPDPDYMMVLGYSNPNLFSGGERIGDSLKANNAKVMYDGGLIVRAHRTAPLTPFNDDRGNYVLIKDNTGFYLRHKSTPASEQYPRTGLSQFTFQNFYVNTEIGDNAKTISLTNLNALVELYIAFMNRVPDSNGLNYWIGRFKAGMTLNQIAESFYSAALLYPELTGYTASMTHADFVIKVYKNVLSRDVTASDSGVQYWVGQLSSGTQSRGQLVFSLLNSAHSFKGDATWGWTANFLDNKLLVGKYFAVEQSLSYKTDSDNVSKGMEIIKRVNPSEVQTAKTFIGITADPNCNLFQ